jgi:hypothetical protein
LKLFLYFSFRFGEGTVEFNDEDETKYSRLEHTSTTLLTDVKIPLSIEFVLAEKSELSFKCVFRHFHLAIVPVKLT